MRYFNKVIFLNSAHVPYAEVKLDGNVHFIGTQGVGKSTLLRAVLFFYNADKYNPQIQISAESETKRSIFREKDKTKRSKKESAQHSKSRNKSFVMTSVSAL